MRVAFQGLSDLPSTGIIAAGGIKYSYPGDVVDLLGLNNSLIAHNNGDRIGVRDHAAFEKRSFFILNPSIVSPRLVSIRDWVFNRSSILNSFSNLVLKQLYEDAEFLETYEYATIEKSEKGNKALAGWFNKSLLNELDNDRMLNIRRYSFSDANER